MPYLNAQIPTLRGWVRAEFLHNQEEKHGVFYECDVVGIKSMSGRVLGFHVLLRNGAVFWSVPIHGMCWKQNGFVPTHYRCQQWDSFSAQVAVTCFDRLSGLTATMRPLGRHPMKGIYHCTLDWVPVPDALDTTVTLTPSEHKSMHLLLGEDGNLYLMPANKLCWSDPAFTVEPFGTPTYRTNSHSWSVERGYRTDDSDKAFVPDADHPEEKRP